MKEGKRGLIHENVKAWGAGRTERRGKDERGVKKEGNRGKRMER